MGKKTKSRKFDDENSDEDFVVKEKKKDNKRKDVIKRVKANQTVSHLKKLDGINTKDADSSSEKEKITCYLDDTDDEDDHVTGMSLMDRLHKKTSGSKVVSSITENTNIKKRPSPRACMADDSEDLESFEIERFEPGKKKNK
jgi:hypothetical protein